MNRYASRLIIIGLMMLSGVAGEIRGDGWREWFGGNNRAAKAVRLHERVEEVKAKFLERDPGMERFFNDSAGYVVFPMVVKAGVGFGGAMGKGEVFADTAVVGTATMTQATVGFQLGGQAYSEIIFFHDNDTLDSFKRNTIEFGAQVSAVAAVFGASDDATFNQGMVVFTMEKGGLMYEATVGGQVFVFREKD